MKYIVALLFLIGPVFAQTGKSESLLLIKDKPVKTEKAEKLTFFTADKPAKKSAMLAVLYSLVLPGMGELYGGNYSSGKYFTIADGAIWGVYAGYNIYGQWQRNNYKTFAQSYGGVSPEGKDAAYYASIGAFSSQEEYNRLKGLAGKFSEMYNGEEYYWQWANTSQRQEYRGMWERSEQSFNDVRFAVGALIINRLISAFNAARIVRNYNKNIESDLSWNVSMSLNQGLNVMPTTLNLNFQKSF